MSLGWGPGALSWVSFFMGVLLHVSKESYASWHFFFMFTMLLENTCPASFLYRPKGEVVYVARMDRGTAEILEGWRGKIMVSNEAMVFSKPSVMAGFRDIFKNLPYWKASVRDESLFRSAYMLAVKFQCLMNHHLRTNKRKNIWVKLSKNVGRVEVPRGCLLSLPPFFSHLWSEIHNEPECGW